MIEWVAYLHFECENARNRTLQILTAYVCNHHHVISSFKVTINFDNIKVDPAKYDNKDYTVHLKKKHNQRWNKDNIGQGQGISQNGRLER